MTAQPWHTSFRADPRALPLADRHYNRQKIGSPQFVPPGRCVVLLTAPADALWVTSWPLAQYVKHAWAGAMVCSLFRREPECPHLASDLITAACKGGLVALQLLPADFPEPIGALPARAAA